VSLSTQTTKQINDGIVASLEAELSQTIPPLLAKAFARVLAWVLAGTLTLLYKYCGFIFLQLFVAFASMEETTIGGKKIRPLVEWGKLLGAGEPEAATRAELVVNVPVTTQVGSLKAGTKLTFEETEIIYEVVAEIALNAATVQATIRATSDPDGGRGEGSIGNLVAGDIVSFVQPTANVASDTTVVSVAKQGADAETPEAYRRRVIRRAQQKPQGGAYADYRAWAEGVEGITNAYPYASDSPGEVDVYVEATEASSGSPDGIPTAPQLTAVAAAIELDVAGSATRRPVNAAVNVLAITRTAFNVTVVGLSPDNADNREAISDGLDEYFRAREPFIVGLSVLPRANRITRAAASGIVDDIVNARGASVSDVVVSPGPAHDLENGQKAKLGTISFPAV
jgi:uncharacterized phage protein gp47/JayE